MWPFRYTHSSEATVFGIRVFAMNKGQWFYRPIMLLHRIAAKASHRWIYFRLRFIDRDHVMKLPIAGHWVDSDERMFLACFQALRYFVEEELGLPSKEWGLESQYRGYRLHSAEGTDQKAIDLWLWYRDELPKLEQEYNDEVRACYGGTTTFGPLDHNGLREVHVNPRREMKFPHDWPETVKDEKLRELIELRRYLWT